MIFKRFARENPQVSLREFIALLLLLACHLPWNQAAVQDTATPTPSAALVTSTPHENGAIFHVVGDGQTLWAIAQAYNTTVDQIRVLNNIAPDSNDIYVGQTLLVRPAGVGSSTFTPQPAAPLSGAESGAPTLFPSTAPTRPRVPPTARSTPTPTPAASAFSFSQQKIPIWAVAIFIAGCVLLVVLFVTRKK